MLYTDTYFLFEQLIDGAFVMKRHCRIKLKNSYLIRGDSNFCYSMEYPVFFMILNLPTMHYSINYIMLFDLTVMNNTYLSFS